MENARRMGEYILGRLAGWRDKFRIVGDVRGKGFHAAITWDDIAPQAGKLGPEVTLLLCTGWSQHWGREEYMKSPHLTEEAARKIVEIGVRVVGIDVFSVDGEVLEGSRRVELTVTPGMFANGYVQVEGPGLREGQSVIEAE